MNDRYISEFESLGLKVAGRSDEQLVEMIELPGQDWFVACQFHPEFTSSPRDGHPLFRGFIEAANRHAAPPWRPRRRPLQTSNLSDCQLWNSAPSGWASISPCS